MSDDKRHAAAPDSEPASAETFIDEARDDDALMLRAALDIVEATGARVVTAHHVRADGTCSCERNPPCKSVGKHPRGLNWQQRASADPAAVEQMWERDPHANIALATGVASGIVVLDVDGEEGELTLAMLEHEHGSLPYSVEAKTGRGRHIYFAAGDSPIPSTVGERGRGLGKGLDLRCENGCVIAPPSMHESGKRYAWVAGHELGLTEVAFLPHWIREHVMRRPQAPAAPRETSHVGLVDASSAWARAALDKEVRIVRAQHEGTRNVQLNASAFNLGQLVATNALDASVVRSALKSAALECGLGEVEAMRTIASGLRGGMKDPRSRPERADESSVHSRATDAVEGAASESAPRVVMAKGMNPRHNTSKLFAELPSQRWTVRGLQLGPGRPMLIAGYGSSAKTLSAQALALAKASGRQIWNHFDSSPGVVIHVDYEQGFYATAKRYQRLAAGHGIDLAELGNRLHLIELPRVFLDEKGAVDEYMRACEGADLVILDALRGAAPHTDENDSSFRNSLDLLTFVSQRTGAAFIVLHHAGKPKDKRGGDTVDVRTLARGSSAIYDASGCVLNFVARNGSNVRHVAQVKQPAEAEGVGVDPFDIVVEDIPVNGNPYGGVRAIWREPAVVDVAAQDAVEFERDAERVLSAVKRKEGGTANAILARCGIKRARALEVLGALVEDGRCAVQPGPNNSKHYRVSP